VKKESCFPVTAHSGEEESAGERVEYACQLRNCEIRFSESDFIIIYYYYYFIITNDIREPG
jgi:hypothetical protein